MVGVVVGEGVGVLVEEAVAMVSRVSRAFGLVEAVVEAVGVVVGAVVEVVVGMWGMWCLVVGVEE